MNTINKEFEEYCDQLSVKYGVKFHWYLGSCCHEVSMSSQEKDFQDFHSSTTIEDSDVLIIGTKLGYADIDFLKSVVNLKSKKVMLFGNCALSGGLFSSENKIYSFKDLESYCDKSFFIPGCPPLLGDFQRVCNEVLGSSYDC